MWKKLATIGTQKCIKFHWEGKQKKIIQNKFLVILKGVVFINQMWWVIGRLCRTWVTRGGKGCIDELGTIVRVWGLSLPPTSIIPPAFMIVCLLACRSYASLQWALVWRTFWLTKLRLLVGQPQSSLCSEFCCQRSKESMEWHSSWCLMNQLHSTPSWGTGSWSIARRKHSDQLVLFCLLLPQRTNHLQFNRSDSWFVGSGLRWKAVGIMGQQFRQGKDISSAEGTK